MRYRVILYTGLFAITCVILVGCGNLPFFSSKKPLAQKPSEASSAVKGTPIAKVNNNTVTLEDLDREIGIYNASLDLMDIPAEDKEKEKIDTRDKKIKYLQNFVIRRMVLYQYALDHGLERREEVQKAMENSKIALLVSELQNEETKNMDVSSAEIEQAYNSIKDQLKEAQQRKIREIVAKSEEDAKQILIELLQGADFTALVRSRSIADSAKDGGDLGYLKFGQRGDRFSMFDQAAFSPALDQGKISNVFKGPDGYYIVKIEDVKEGKQLGLSDVWDKLKEQLLISKQQQKLNELYSRLSRDAKIEIYEKEIK